MNVWTLQLRQIKTEDGLISPRSNLPPTQANDPPVRESSPFNTDFWDFLLLEMAVSSVTEVLDKMPWRCEFKFFCRLNFLLKVSLHEINPFGEILYFIRLLKK